MSLFNNARKRSRRRVWAISAFTGPNGGGKSMAMVHDTIPSLERGRPVLSTVRLLDYENPRDCEGCDDEGHLVPVYEPVEPPEGIDPRVWIRHTHPEERRLLVGHRVHGQAHPLYVPLRGWDQLMEASGVDVLLDEVTGVASSRESAGLPAAVANKLVQLRRADVVVRWSAPAWARADKIIRECTQAVTYCQGYVPRYVKDSDREWRQRSFFSWKTYDAQLFEDFTSGKRESLRPEVVDWYRLAAGVAHRAYDTFDAVNVVGTVTDSGRCYGCGGKRMAPECTCSDYVHRKAQDAALRASARQDVSPARRAAPRTTRLPDPIPGPDLPSPAPLGLVGPGH